MTMRDLRRFAPYTLLLSLIAAITAGLLFIVQKSFTLPIQISLGVIVIGLALFVLLDPQGTREALTGRQARYGSNALLMSLAFIGIIIVVNYLVSGHSKQWDLTEDQQNSLTTETINTLASLKSPVKAEAFFTANTSGETARNMLMNFKSNSQGKFDFEFVDPNANPILAQQDNITRDGTIVLKMDNRQEQVTSVSEEDLTGALVRLANPGKRSVYFLTGHGEYGFDSTSDSNYSQLRTALTAKNYTVNTLNLLATPKIPEDALAIIIAGPTKPLAQSEIDLIKAYQEKGGSLVYLAEPRPVTEFGDAPDPMAAYLNEAWGIGLDEDLVVDMSSNQALVAISQSFGSHAITQKMTTKAIVLPSARSVEVEKTPANITLTKLAETSNMAWGETDYQSIQNQKVKADQGKDIMGPVNLAVAGENSTTHARVLVVGDSDFASSKAYSSYGNSDFILNGLDWAAAQDNLISLTPRQPTERFLAPPQTYTFGLILLGSVFLLPGLVVLTGVTVWLQRRRRG
jgi:ABC-type uncharacterized transport system involved in gliding motility auxiliary subunit